MPESFPIECPNCRAQGELADATLLGKPIACPACQQVFVASDPRVPVQPEMPQVAPVADTTIIEGAAPQIAITEREAATELISPHMMSGAVATQQSSGFAVAPPIVPQQPPPLFIPDSVPASSGAAEHAFASSLPEPAVRSNLRSSKPQTKTMTIVIVSSISALVLFSIAMFLMGDPMRSITRKQETTSKKQAPAKAQRIDPQQEEKEREEMWARIPK